MESCRNVTVVTLLAGLTAAEGAAELPGMGTGLFSQLGCVRTEVPGHTKGAVVWKAITWRSPNTPEGMTVGRASNKAQHSIPRPVNTLLGLAMVIQRAPSVQTYPPEEVGPGLCRAPEHNLASKGMGMVLGSAGGTQQLMQPALRVRLFLQQLLPPNQAVWKPGEGSCCTDGCHGSIGHGGATIPGLERGP